MAPDHAMPLTKDAPGWAKLDAGIWFKCTCGRIGHISDLLYADNTTTMWCPHCKEDNWDWTKQRNAHIKQTQG